MPTDATAAVLCAYALVVGGMFMWSLNDMYRLRYNPDRLPKYRLSTLVMASLVSTFWPIVFAVNRFNRLREKINEWREQKLFH